jgi:hypothetical protein
LRWVKTSNYSIRAKDAPFAVSKALVLDRETGELVERFSAWRGDPLSAGGPMPRLLGVFDSAAQAKACCASLLD